MSDYHHHTQKCDGMCDTCDCPESVRLPDHEPEPVHTIKVNMTMDLELLKRATAAETEAALLRRELSKVNNAARELTRKT